MTRTPSLGELVIRAVIKADVLTVADAGDNAVIFVWSANAEEQLEAALLERWPRFRAAYQRAEKSRQRH